MEILHLLRASVSATRDQQKHILDWFHISMRVRHVEQALAGLLGSNWSIRPAHGFLQVRAAVMDGSNRSLIAPKSVPLPISSENARLLRAIHRHVGT
jgi:hypothetical protein